jgi:hypothetical protein
LRVEGLDTREADDAFRLTGTIRIPTTPAVDPLAHGVAITYADPAGAIVDAVLPGGAWSSATRAGWRTNGPRTRFTWSGAGPIGKMALRAHHSIAGQYDVTVVGKRRDFGSRRPLSLDPQITVALLRPFAGTEQCAEFSFPGPPAGPSCTVRGNGARLECR